MVSSTDWKFEAWKAAVSLTEKVLLVFLGALVIPVLLQKDPFPSLAITIGIILTVFFSVLWIVLGLRAYLKTKRGEQ